MKVGYSYLKDQFKNHEIILKKISEVVEAGDFTLGKEVQKFEENFSSFLGAKFGIGVNSGTDSLFLSLKSIGVGPGDEVITTPNTFIATLGAIMATGARPVFVDVTDEYVMDPGKIAEAINSNTKAILPVHYAGVPADMPEMMLIAEKYGLFIIEDACQAIGASLNGKKVGTYGTTGGFSLHPLKNLNVWGDGGIIVTNNEKIRDQLILLRNHGLGTRDTVVCFGYNSRLDTIQAAIGNHLIKDIDWITETRIKWANKLDFELSKLPDFINIPQRKPHKKYVYHLYMIKVKNRDDLLKYLLANGIGAKIHYPVPLHLQPCSKNLGYQEGDFPVTEAQVKSIITLPVHQHLAEEQIDYVISKVKEFYNKKSNYSGT
jgi:dTDP-4-amino-4,6-dideoxygalactose transaminase